jgi:gluconolactonase
MVEPNPTSPMKASFVLSLFLLLVCAPLSPVRGESDAYVPGPDSVVQAGVPQGELITFDFSDSRIFPGTTRQVTVYVPKAYDPARPACLYVDQDGVQWNGPVVLDNLIARKELPIIIGVFVTPGVLKAATPATQLSRFNRSLEYDGLGDSYVRFLLEELLPVVETKVTTDGRPVHLSHSANDRAIAGSSSGAIAAFTAAWERPDAFSRVFSSIGTYIGLRGGDRYPTLIRKYEPKAIRVFLQDGSNDLNIYAGDWWMANQTMERALEFGGYEVNHAWGDGGHTGKQATSVLPDALRWLWKDWPKPVERGLSKNGALKALLIPGEDWKAAGPAHGEGVAADAKGAITFQEAAPSRTAPDGAAVPARGVDPQGGYRRLGPDGRVYSVDRSDSAVISFEPKAGRKILAEGLAARELVVAHNGNLYVTADGSQGGPSPDVWLIRPNGEKLAVDTGIRSATGITLSPDQSLLYVADGGSHWIYSFRVLADGTLADRQRYYWLHEADSEDASDARGMCCDRAGWLYVATALGVQVCDQAGRVNAILPVPTGRVTDLGFGGEHFDVLYAACSGTLYSRRLAAVGANPADEPSLPPAPRL